MSETIVLEGVVRATHRGDHHEVEVTLDGGATWTVLARRSGRLVKHHIRLIVGDVVQVEVSGFDPRRGRIVRRGSKERAA